MTGRESGENGWNTGKSGDGRIVLCGANSYEQKYYFNPDFKMLPKSVQEELHILCASYLMCMGMASMLAAQVIINIGMVLQWLPVIGITLPFFSAGGSSNLCVYIGIGLMMSIYRFNQKTPVANFRLQRVVTRFST